MQSTETQTQQLEDGMVDVIELGPQGDKRKPMRLDEAIRVVRAALKNGKAVFQKTKDGKGDVVRTEKDVDKKTKEVTVAPPVAGG